MRKRSLVILLILIVVCIIVNIWGSAAKTQQALTFTVPPIRLVSAILAAPLLWICVGTLAGALLARNFKMADSVKRILKIIGIVLLAIYVCLTICWAVISIQGLPFTVFYWCVTHAVVLAAPGLLLGLSLRAEKTA